MIGIEPVLYIGISQSFFAGLLISPKITLPTGYSMAVSICIELVPALINNGSEM
jgi:hypothetical protein